MPSETTSFPQPFVIPANFRHSRENGNLEPLNFQIIFEYCRRPEGLDSRLRGNDGGRMPSETLSFPQPFVIPAIFRHSRESGNLELLNFQTTFEYCRCPKG